VEKVVEEEGSLEGSRRHTPPPARRQVFREHHVRHSARGLKLFRCLVGELIDLKDSMVVAASRSCCRRRHFVQAGDLTNVVLEDCTPLVPLDLRPEGLAKLPDVCLERGTQSVRERGAGAEQCNPQHRFFCET
jgi:hypothetical protein